MLKVEFTAKIGWTSPSRDFGKFGHSKGCKTTRNDPPRTIKGASEPHLDGESENTNHFDGTQSSHRWEALTRLVSSYFRNRQLPISEIKSLGEVQPILAVKSTLSMLKPSLIDECSAITEVFWKP